MLLFQTRRFIPKSESNSFSRHARETGVYIFYEAFELPVFCKFLRFLKELRYMCAIADNKVLAFQLA